MSLLPFITEQISGVPVTGKCGERIGKLALNTADGLYWILLIDCFWNRCFYIIVTLSEPINKHCKP